MKLKNSDLIAVNKIIISLRKNGTKLNYAVMNAKFAQIGIDYFFYNEDNGIYMCPHPVANRSEIVSRNITVYTSGKDGRTALRLNMKNLYEEECYISIYKYKDGFLLTKSSKTQADLFGSKLVKYVKSGHVSNSRSMNLSPADAKKLTKGYYVCVIDCRETVSLYLKPVSEEEYLNTPTLSECNTFLPYYSYRFTSGKFVYFPQSFLDAEKIQKQSWLECSWKNKEFHIELEPVICDLCKKQIKRSKEKVYTYQVDSFTKGVIDMLSTYTSVGSNTKTELRKIDKTLSSILEKLEENHEHNY